MFLLGRSCQREKRCWVKNVQAEIVIANFAIMEPRHTPITPNRRVKEIERARLLEPAMMAIIIWRLSTPEPLSNISATLETAETTSQTPRTMKRESRN